MAVKPVYRRLGAYSRKKSRYAARKCQHRKICRNRRSTHNPNGGNNLTQIVSNCTDYTAKPNMLFVKDFPHKQHCRKTQHRPCPTINQGGYVSAENCSQQQSHGNYAGGFRRRIAVYCINRDYICKPKLNSRNRHRRRKLKLNDKNYQRSRRKKRKLRKPFSLNFAQSLP